MIPFFGYLVDQERDGTKTAGIVAGACREVHGGQKPCRPELQYLQGSALRHDFRKGVGVIFRHYHYVSRLDRRFFSVIRSAAILLHVVLETPMSLEPERFCRATVRPADF